MDEDCRICDVDEVPADTTRLITVREGLTGEEKEAILIRLNGEVRCWLNYCQHWLDVKLDRGDGALVRGDDIVCQKHGATFQKDSGYCDFGPCEGSYLAEVDLNVEEDEIYLDDSNYEYLRDGGTGDDDLSSGGRIDF